MLLPNDYCSGLETNYLWQYLSQASKHGLPHTKYKPGEYTAYLFLAKMLMVNIQRFGGTVQINLGRYIKQYLRQ